MEERKISMEIADDNGNGLRKLVITKIEGKEQKEIEFIKPNVMSRMSNHNNTDTWQNSKLLELKDNLMVSFLTEEEIKAGKESDEYFYIGKYALEGGGSLESININSPTGKLETDVTLCGLGYVATEAIKFTVEEIMEKEDKSIDEIDIDEIKKIVADVKYLSALPVRVFNKENKENLIEIIKKYEGITARVVVSDNKYIDVKINFNGKITAIPEAVDVTYFLINPTKEFLDALNKENGFSGDKIITKQYFEKENRRIMHLSIGEGTTEYPVTYNKVYWDEQFKRGSDNGVGTALEIALSELSNKGFTMFNSRQSIMESYLDTDDRFHEEVKAAFEPPLKTQSNEVFKILSEELSKAKKVDTLIVYGGGSIAMKNVLKPQIEKLCSRMRVNLLYVPSEYAVKLEALGLKSILNSNK